MAVATAVESASPGAAAPEVDRNQMIEALIQGDDKREKFIPITRFALLERLTRPTVWPQGDAEEARRFFRYLDFWRAQSYTRTLLALEQAYEPLSPDSDLLVTRRYTDDDRRGLQRQVVDSMAGLLRQANYTRIDGSQVELIMTKDTHYGLDLHVDLEAFDELMICYRGHSTRRISRRNPRRLYLKRQEFDVPIFQRLFVLFKLKSVEVRVEEVMRQRGCERREAEKLVTRTRGMLPGEIKSDFIYMKLFKNMPCSDLEMVFPNTRVRFRMFDKIKLGVTTGGGLGMGIVGTAGKIAVATNPIALAGAVAGLGGIAIRQGIAFMNQRNRYMMTMAQNLYFHAMADNRGVMTLLADRAAEEDIKEEMLLYSILAKERVNRAELRDVDHAVEQYLANGFGIENNFDVEDALTRLIADGIVREDGDGTLHTLPPAEAARRIDAMWDTYLDNLPDPGAGIGREMDRETA